MASLRLKCAPFLEKIQGKCGFCVPLEPLVLFKSENFYIVLSLGQIVEGYSLICTKLHRSCCGDILPDQINEFMILKKLLQEVFMKVYNKKTIFYEHGQTGVCMKHLIDNMQNHCYHAHLHALPCEIDIFDLIKEKVPQCIKITDLHELIKIRNQKLKGGAYLFYENNKGEKFIFPAKGIKLPRQFLRRCVASQIEQPHLFDWERYPGWRKLSSAYKKLRPIFQRYENKKIQ
jgi:diadenosine tetraphosphate (Ap4A) HIT family hydrolase